MKTSKLPWYLHPSKQCRVMNRLANRWFTKHASMEVVRASMDLAQELLWSKVENYYTKKGLPI